MSLPQSNARLTLVAGGGTTEDYDVPAGADTQRWAGSAPAYFSERVLEDTTNGRLSEVKQAFLIVDRHLPLDVALGDSVTFTHRGTPQTREVTQVRAVEGASTQRLYLRDA